MRSVAAAEEAVAVELEAGGGGVAWSVYLPDPDGYQVAITTYEPTGASAGRKHPIVGR